MNNTCPTLVAAVAAFVGAASGQLSFTLIGNALLDYNPNTGFVDPEGTGYQVTGALQDGSVVVGVIGDYVWKWDAASGGLPVWISEDGGGLASISADGTLISANHTYPYPDPVLFPPGTFAIDPVVTNGLLEMPSLYDVASQTWTPLPVICMDDGMGGCVTNGIELDNATGAAFAMSADGSTVVGYGWIDAGGTSGAFASDGITTVQLDAGGNTASRATCANTDGSIIGGTLAGNRKPAVWKNGVLTQISPIAGDLNGISADGLFLTGSAGRVATLWEDDGDGGYIERQFDKIDPFGNSDGIAVTADGLFVAGVEVIGSVAIGWVWTPATGLVQADDYLDLIGVSRPMVTVSTGFTVPFSVADCTWVSADGTLLGGWGVGEGDALFMLRRSFVTEIVRPCSFGDYALPFGTLNADDHLAYLDALAADENHADVNGDGTRDFFDMIAHLRAYDAGCD